MDRQACRWVGESSVLPPATASAVTRGLVLTAPIHTKGRHALANASPHAPLLVVDAATNDQKGAR